MSKDSSRTWNQIRYQVRVLKQESHVLKMCEKKSYLNYFLDEFKGFKEAVRLFVFSGTKIFLVN